MLLFASFSTTGGVSQHDSLDHVQDGLAAQGSFELKHMYGVCVRVHPCALAVRHARRAQEWAAFARSFRRLWAIAFGAWLMKQNHAMGAHYGLSMPGRSRFQLCGACPSEESSAKMAFSSIIAPVSDARSSSPFGLCGRVFLLPEARFMCDGLLMKGWLLRFFVRLSFLPRGLKYPIYKDMYIYTRYGNPKPYMPYCIYPFW